MTPQVKQMVESYGRNLLGQLVTAIAIVGQGASPITFTASQWADVSNVLWGALIPVLLRYINKKDPAFGRVAAPLLEEAKKASATAIKKKAIAKKTSKKG
jgi:hypothetical protein